MKQKIMNYLKKYAFLLFCIAIMLFYLMDFCIKLDSRDEYQYSEKKINSQVKELNQGCVEQYTIKPIAEGMKYYKVHLIDNPSGGQLSYAISDKDGQVLKYSDLLLQSKSETLDIDVNELHLKKNDIYYLTLQLKEVDKLTVCTNDDNVLQADMVYAYEDGKLLQSISILILLIFATITFWIVRTRNFYKKFVVLSMAIGMIFLFAVPPCTAPDELRHFARAYDITEGNFLCRSIQTKEEFDNMTLPTCKIPSELFQLRMLSEENEEKYTGETNHKIVFQKWKDVISKKTGESDAEIPIHGTATISPLAYIPQIIGILIAKLFGSHVGALYYLCKFANLLFATLIGLFALYITPKFKEGIFVLWFIPSLVHLRSSCSTDGILFALIIFVLAVFLKMYEEGKLENRYFIAVVIAEIIIGQIKLPYVFSSFIFLLCKMDKKVQSGRVLAISSFVISCLSYGIYSKINSFRLDSIGNSQGIISYVKEFISHPVSQINMLFQSFINDSWLYFKKAFILLDCEIIMVCFLICILFTMKYCTDSISGGSKCKAICIYGSLFMWAGIIGIFAVESFKLSTGYLWGVQGRYMLPVFPVLFLGIARDNRSNDKNVKLYNKIELAVVSLLFIYLYKMVNLFWI